MLLFTQHPFYYRGTGPLTWHWQHLPFSNHSRMDVEEHRCKRQSEAHLTCSYLKLTKAEVKDTGYFTCLYKHQTKNSLRLQARIYLYVKGKTTFYFLIIELPLKSTHA